MATSLLVSCKSNVTKLDIFSEDIEISNKVEDLVGKMTLGEEIAEMAQDASANDHLGISFL